MRGIRVGLSWLLLIVVLAGALVGSLPILSRAAEAVGMAQLVPSLLRWTARLTGGAGAALFVLPLLLIATLLFGRLYCSTLCPLGTLQELVSPSLRRRRWRFMRPHRWLRAAIALLLLGAWVAGSALPLALLEPYSLFHRAAVTALLRPPAVAAAVLSLALLAAVALLARSSGRLYCNTLCPAGLALSVAATRPLFRIRIDGDRCTACGRCERLCPARCIDVEHRRVAAGSCILCLDCLGSCPAGALHYCARRERR